MFVTTSLLYDLVGLVVALAAISIAYFQYSFQHWKKKGVPYLEPTIPFGNICNPWTRKETFGVTVKNFYKLFKERGYRHAGLYIFAAPVYLPLDIEYVKNILSKDFSYFVDRGMYHNEDVEPMSAHLFAVGGTKWRNLRTKLTPTFTSGKMKHMFQTLVDCESNLSEFADRHYKTGEPFDIKEMLGCFTTDIIGSCAFGLECNTFKEKNSPFRIYGKKSVSNETGYRKFLVAFVQSFPNVGRALRLKFIREDVTDFFTKVVKDTVSYRESNNVVRKDFLQMLIDLKNNKLAEEDGYKHDGKTLTIDEIVAQSFIFFLAGFETSSTTMTFALYELARNPDIQDKVRAEMNEVLKKHDGKITYDAIQELKYIQQVIDETLRMYPPVPFITRQCVKDYKVPDENCTIDTGTRVFIPVYGIHYDPAFYPEPDKFDPERFNEENKHSRHPYAHMPFGEGPRLCIGMRFGLMQSKVGLMSLLTKYKFSVNKNTKQPLNMSPDTFVLAAEGDIWLDAQRL